MKKNEFGYTVTVTIKKWRKCPLEIGGNMRHFLSSIE